MAQRSLLSGELLPIEKQKPARKRTGSAATVAELAGEGNQTGLAGLAGLAGLTLGETAALEQASADTIKRLSQVLQLKGREIREGVLHALDVSRIQLDERSNCYWLETIFMKREDYQQFEILMSALRAKRKGLKFGFSYNPANLIQQVIRVGKMPKINPFSLHPTPVEIAEFMLELADLIKGLDLQYEILEPSAGTGSIAQTVRLWLPNSNLDVCELDPFNQLILQQKGCNLIGTDFLKLAIGKRYDLIFMNPPFEGIAYITHIKQAFRHLKMHGILVSVVPASLLNSDQPQAVEFRNWVAEIGYWEPIGRVFETTNCDCIIIKLVKVSPQQLEEWWSTSNMGYSSWYHQMVAVTLSTESRWSDFIHSVNLDQPEHALKREFGRRLDGFVNSWIKNGWTYCWNEEVRQAAIEEGIESARISQELARKFQQSELKRLQDAHKKRIKTISHPTPDQKGKGEEQSSHVRRRIVLGDFY